MAYRHGERSQSILFPQSIDEYVSADDPVRVYDAFVEQLDLISLGIETNNQKVGCPEYNPKAMLKLLLYGYSYGERSSRKLERAVHHNISFVWLMANLKPDHKTIARFRSKNKIALSKLLKQCARMCIDLDLIMGNTLFVDGSKFRANAGIDNTKHKSKLEKQLKEIDQRIAKILTEAEVIDEQESNEPSLVKMPKELTDKKILRSKIKAMLKKMEVSGKEKLNTTDPESCLVKSRQGSHAGYNAQITVDQEHGLIVNSDVVNENHDINQFAEQIKQAEKVLNEPAKNVCADNGYVNYEKLKEVTQSGKTVIVPSKKQAQRKASENPFGKEHFYYDEQADQYKCPAGKTLKLKKIRKDKKVKVYRIKKAKICRYCQHFKECCNSRYGRELHRNFDEEYRDHIAQCYAKPENQAIYAKRKAKVELPFGHIKKNLGTGAFLLRGVVGARAEMSLLSSCFNIRRMITILGVAGVIGKLTG